MIGYNNKNVIYVTLKLKMNSIFSYNVLNTQIIEKNDLTRLQYTTKISTISVMLAN